MSSFLLQFKQTSCRPIRSVIILVINKIERLQSELDSTQSVLLPLLINKTKLWCSFAKIFGENTVPKTPLLPAVIRSNGSVTKLQIIIFNGKETYLTYECKNEGQTSTRQQN